MMSTNDAPPTLARQVESRLRESRYASLQDVICEECDGAFRLRGSLPSHYLKQLALEAARTLAGARPIVNEIQVVPRRRPVSSERADSPRPWWGWQTAADTQRDSAAGTLP